MQKSATIGELSLRFLWWPFVSDRNVAPIPIVAPRSPVELHGVSGNLSPAG